MRHTYEFGMRWADMDNADQVNTVTAADYLQEARIAMFSTREGFLGGESMEDGVVVTRHELDFLQPLAFQAERPIRIESWVTRIGAASFVVASELAEETPAGRIVYMRASTTAAPFDLASSTARRLGAAEQDLLHAFLEPGTRRERAPRQGRPRHTHPIQVRWSDVDGFKHVNNVKYLEYLHEARAFYLLALQEPGDVFGRTAVVRTDVDYRRPITYRRAPYDAHVWVSHVGRTSFTLAFEICDGEEVLAKAEVVLAGFDRRTGTVEPLTADQRARLTAELDAQSPVPAL